MQADFPLPPALATGICRQAAGYAQKALSKKEVNEPQKFGSVQDIVTAGMEQDEISVLDLPVNFP